MGPTSMHQDDLGYQTRYGILEFNPRTAIFVTGTFLKSNTPFYTNNKYLITTF